MLNCTILGVLLLCREKSSNYFSSCDLFVAGGDCCKASEGVEISLLGNTCSQRHQEMACCHAKLYTFCKGPVLPDIISEYYPGILW